MVTKPVYYYYLFIIIYIIIIKFPVTYLSQFSLHYDAKS